MIFSAASSLQGIKEVFTAFYGMSSVKVGYQISKVCFNCLNDEEQQGLGAMLGLKVGHLPVRYLELPLISGKLKDKD